MRTPLGSRRRALVPGAPRIALTLALALVAACTTKTQGQQTNPGEAKTVGDQCALLAQALCDRAVRDCGMQAQGGYAQCVQDNTTACCQGKCAADKSPQTKDAELEQCITELKATSCATFKEKGTDRLPPVCVGAVKLP